MKANPRFTLETIKENTHPGIDPFLPPAIVAELIGVDMKWLAAAREGRKNIQGPQYVKLGEGRTAPIRYRLSSLVAWMASFEERASTASLTKRIASPHTSLSRLMTNGAPTDRWLFIITPDNSDAIDVFDALKKGICPSNIKLIWLSRSDYAARRFIKVTTQLDAGTVKELINLGGGNINTGIEHLLAKYPTNQPLQRT